MRARAVGIVLDRRDRRRHAHLVALEVDHAVALLVAAAAEARGDAAVVVAAAGRAHRARGAPSRARCPVVISAKSGATRPRRPGEVGVVVDEAHGLDSLEELDVVCRPRGSRSPSSSSDRLPTKRPMRFSLPRTTSVRTSTTLTLNSFSTAWRISTLFASRATSNTTCCDVRLALACRVGAAAGLLEARALLGEERTLDDCSGERMASLPSAFSPAGRARAPRSPSTASCGDHEARVVEDVVDVEALGRRGTCDVGEVARRRDRLSLALPSTTSALARRPSVLSDAGQPSWSWPSSANASTMTSFFSCARSESARRERGAACTFLRHRVRVVARLRARTPCRRRRSAARGSSPGARCRCPSACTASCRRREPRARLGRVRAGARLPRAAP